MLQKGSFKNTLLLSLLLFGRVFNPGQTQTGLGSRVYPFATPRLD